eukprot:766154-Hanusia_phi.AAC.7
MLFSNLYSQQFKFDPADIQRSAISGGVAISSVASLFVHPYQAMLIGFAGGFACSTSHNFLRKFLERKLMITDTVGVVSLHAIPSAIAWIAGELAHSLLLLSPPTSPPLLLLLTSSRGISSHTHIFSCPRLTSPQA